jgi:hypothetical protein
MNSSGGREFDPRHKSQKTCSLMHINVLPEERFFTGEQEGYAPEWEGENMEILQSFRVAARERGFTEVTESGGGTVVWLKRKASVTVRETHQRICIDGLTRSATVYWMTVPGDLKSKTFRDVPKLQEWFELQLEVTLQR